MEIPSEIGFAIAFALIAFLYASVGHAGASGYLALMSIFAFEISTVKPTSLSLNIFVAGIAFFHFYKSKYFDFHVFWPFAISSVPMAFVGGYIHLPATIFKLAAGIFLIISSLNLLIKVNQPVRDDSRELKLIPALLIGGVIGFVSGVIGVGGGIFLTPILIFSRWTTVKVAAGVSALFILVNSIVAFSGNWLATQQLPGHIWLYLTFVGIGGFAGAYLGANQFKSSVIYFFLFLVLLTAGLKFIFW